MSAARATAVWRNMVAPDTVEMDDINLINFGGN